MWSYGIGNYGYMDMTDGIIGCFLSVDTAVLWRSQCDVVHRQEYEMKEIILKNKMPEERRETYKHIHKHTQTHTQTHTHRKREREREKQRGKEGKRQKIDPVLSSIATPTRRREGRHMRHVVGIKPGLPLSSWTCSS